MSKSLWRAFVNGFIDNDEKEASEKKKKRIQDKSAKTIPFLKPKWPKSIPYLWPIPFPLSIQRGKFGTTLSRITNEFHCVRDCDVLSLYIRNWQRKIDFVTQSGFSSVHLLRSLRILLLCLEWVICFEGKSNCFFFNSCRCCILYHILPLDKKSGLHWPSYHTSLVQEEYVNIFCSLPLT